MGGRGTETVGLEKNDGSGTASMVITGVEG